MPKKWIVTRGGPENKKYFTEVEIAKLKDKKDDAVPEPPPNFFPGEMEGTTQGLPSPVLTGAQAYFEAMERKED
ncbi:hypothetical protein ISR94_03900 [Candidatus Microgenomates bacterium]|nr:hypothetical protein [Candidatus Microgenomates bacterium]